MNKLSLFSSLQTVLMFRRPFGGTTWLCQEQPRVQEAEVVKPDPYAEIPDTSYKLHMKPIVASKTYVHKDVKLSYESHDSLGLIDLSLTMFEYVKGDQHHTHKIFNNQHHSYKQGQRIEQRTFVDLKMIRLQTGKGGNGCVSFFRDANRAVGPPDGGDGGMGGNIYISAVNGIGSLHRIKKSYVAGPGKSGHSSQLDGKRGDDVVIEVPVGTTIRWIPKPVEVQVILPFQRRHYGDQAVMPERRERWCALRGVEDWELQS